MLSRTLLCSAYIAPWQERQGGGLGPWGVMWRSDFVGSARSSTIWVFLVFWGVKVSKKCTVANVFGLGSLSVELVL